MPIQTRATRLPAQGFILLDEETTLPPVRRVTPEMIAAAKEKASENSEALQRVSTTAQDVISDA